MAESLLFGMAYRYYQGILERVLDETPQVKRFFIRIPELSAFTFHAGQFVMLDLPIESKIKTRAYSIASPPDESNLLELVIVLKDGGLGTSYLFGETREGSRILISEPIGKFTRPRPERFEIPLCFICTGTGVAPFRSMIYDILNHKVPFETIYLVTGSRLPADLLYLKEWNAMQEKLPNFFYRPVLSRAGEDWSGRKGYVHEHYTDIAAQFPETLFYICGWKEMINQARKNLMDYGISKTQIRFEMYD